MFADWELIGVPHRVTLGDRGIKEGMVEYQHRRDSASQSIALADIASHVKAQLLV
jgi:prolyl-tRNA synthetase